MGQGLLDLMLEHWPTLFVQLITRSGVQVHRVEEHPPDIVLTLVPRPVADPYRPGPVVAGEMVKGGFGQLALATDAVHDLECGVLLSEIGQEVEEVVRFPVQSEFVQAGQHEGGVAHPAVPIIVVAVAPGVSGREVVAAASKAPVGA